MSEDIIEELLERAYEQGWVDASNEYRNLISDIEEE